MAELNVQPKKSASIVPWILLLLGIAALIWFLVNRNKDDDNVASTNSAAITSDSGTNQSTSSNTANADWSMWILMHRQLSTTKSPTATLM